MYRGKSRINLHSTHSLKNDTTFLALSILISRKLVGSEMKRTVGLDYFSTKYRLFLNLGMFENLLRMIGNVVEEFLRSGICIRQRGN